MKIIIEKADLIQQEVDAIVNPANSLGYMGGGVAAAIKRAAGQVVEKEAIKQAPIPVGKAILTTAGKLKARFVIHAPTMEKPAQRISTSNVERALKAALELADNTKLKSIAIPGLGTGVGGVSWEEAANVFAKVLKQFTPKHLEVIKIVDINDGFIEAVRKVFNNANIPFS